MLNRLNLKFIEDIGIEVEILGILNISLFNYKLSRRGCTR